MPKLKQRDLVKEAIRTYASPDVATWDEAAAKVGLDGERLAWWQRRPEWVALCREVGEEDLARSLPVAVRRLVDAAHLDKSSSGVTAAKALIDICRDKRTEEVAATEDGASEEVDLGHLSSQELALLCRLLPQLLHRLAN
ncbi:MAG: hypothetical protein FJX75_21380 [Armatimonadetes bacterium]|nr:hypothetical protein [Armatimonadota bacterium]